MKRLQFIQRSQGVHWVGDGFPVRTVFSYSDIAEKVSPFLLLDYAGPARFSPTTEKLGVGEHPHRGFETVTIVYDGEVEHRDSSGGGGKIGPGDVQWMTAASGLVHEEFHGRDFAQKGGAFEMVQLWVNLPAKDKKAAPRYQTLTHAEIPEIPLPDGAGTLRVIAGSWRGKAGPARTFTPIELWDLRAVKGHRVELEVPADFSISLFVLGGEIRIPGAEEPVRDAELAVLGREGAQIEFEVVRDTKLLLLAGQPLNEPIVGHGPFVMNTKDEIREAIRDFQEGRMGRLAP